MPAFTISDDHNITAFATAAEAACENALVFESEADLARIAAEWPMGRLIEVYNSIPGNGEVKRFANRNKGVRRIWTAIQPLARNFERQPEPSAETESAKPAKTAQPQTAAKPRRKRTAGEASKSSTAKRSKAAKRP